jgi:hypothetical protein
MVQVLPWQAFNSAILASNISVDILKILVRCLLSGNPVKTHVLTVFNPFVVIYLSMLKVFCYDLSMLKAIGTL